MMVNKWRVLESPLELSLEHNSDLLEAISRIHNFCIDEGIVNVEHELRSAEPVINMSSPVNGRHDSIIYLPSEPPSYRTAQRVEQYSGLWRDMVKNYIETLGLTRPSYNILRNS